MRAPSADEVRGLDGAGPVDIEGQIFGIRGFVIDLEDEILEIQDDGGDVLIAALDGREFVTDAFDLNRIDGRAGKGAEEDAAKRVSKRNAETSFKRGDEEFRVIALVDHRLDRERLELVGKVDEFFLFGFVDNGH